MLFIAHIIGTVLLRAYRHIVHVHVLAVNDIHDPYN